MLQRVGINKAGPPLTQAFWALTRGAAKQHEVIARPKARQLQHALWEAANAFIEPGLQGPDLAHVGLKAPLNHHAFALGRDHVVHGGM